MKYKNFEVEDMRVEEELDKDLDSDSMDLYEWGFQMGYYDNMEEWISHFYNIYIAFLITK